MNEDVYVIQIAGYDRDWHDFKEYDCRASAIIAAEALAQYEDGPPSDSIRIVQGQPKIVWGDGA